MYSLLARYFCSPFIFSSHWAHLFSCPSPTPRGILVWRDMAVNVTVSGPADRVRAIQLFNLGNGAWRSTGILPVFFGHGAGCPCYVDWKTDLPCRPGSGCCAGVIESWTMAVVSR